MNYAAMFVVTGSAFMFAALWAAIESNWEGTKKSPSIILYILAIIFLSLAAGMGMK